MALHDRPIRLTYEDFLQIPEDGRRHEILDGEHYVSAAPYLKHQSVSMQLAVALGLFIRANRLGRLWTAPVDVLLSPHDIVEPDLVFVSQERLGILTERNIQGAPDLIIEILSRSTRRIDLGLKREIYERSGVQEYWLVDPDRETVTVHRLENGHYRTAAELTASDDSRLTTPLLPGLELRVVDLFVP